jgi:hypothetical protein
LDFFEEGQSIEGAEGKTPQRAQHYYQHATDFHIVFACFFSFRLFGWRTGSMEMLTATMFQFF